MTGKDRKRGLGRGLSALMADVAEVEPVEGQAQRAEQTLPIEKIHPNPNQPRKTFEPEALAELVSSIKEKGVLQPLIVRPVGSDFEIVAGERRWRAAQSAQLHELPVVIRDLTDTEMLEIAIIENIQRADLNPIEEAMGYKQLMERFGHTQERLATALGKSRSHIANLMRLLQLPESVQNMVLDGRLSAGHARAMITAPDPESVAKEVVSKGLSVRATEALAKKDSTQPKSQSQPRAASVEKDADTRALEADLSAATGVRVTLNHSGDGETGQIVLSYSSLDQLDDLCRKLSAP